MANITEKWFKKIKFLYAGSLQIERALNDVNPSKAELIFGYISAAVMLETFVNFYAQENLSNDPEFLKVFSKLELNQKAIYLPRFCKGLNESVQKYEKSNIHIEYRPVISYRNKLAHGNLIKAELDKLRTKELEKLWSAVVDMFLLLVSTIHGQSLEDLKASENSFDNLRFIKAKGKYSSEFLEVTRRDCGNL